jgi:hypothetical protein
LDRVYWGHRLFLSGIYGDSYLFLTGLSLGLLPPYEGCQTLQTNKFVLITLRRIKGWSMQHAWHR